jgi:enamine deaminase RidA (YjgF/YER057c/UK114 family)
MRQLVSSGSQWESAVGYSRAVRVGRSVVVAGTTATRDGLVVGIGDPYEQTKVALEIIAAALAECGAGLADVVRTRMYVTDISRWEEVGRAHVEVFGQIRPAATMVEVSALVDPEHLVEIEVEALLATGFIFTVHFFNTHGRPEKFPMDFVIFNGQISKHEFMEERRDQWQRYEEAGMTEKFAAKKSSGIIYDFLIKGFGFIALFTGIILLFLMIYAILTGGMG